MWPEHDPLPVIVRLQVPNLPSHPDSQEATDRKSWGTCGCGAWRWSGVDSEPERREPKLLGSSQKGRRSPLGSSCPAFFAPAILGASSRTKETRGRWIKE